MAIMSRVTWGAEPDEVSMLHAVRYVKTSGGLDRMLATVGGAQQDHFVEGTTRCRSGWPRNSATGSGWVRWSRIEWSEDAVAVTSSAGVSRPAGPSSPSRRCSASTSTSPRRLRSNTSSWRNGGRWAH